jgi:hypothetical protein
MMSSIKTELAPEGCQQHVTSGGGVCPFCGHDDVEGEDVTTGGGEASQEMSCPACNAAWVDTYTLTDIQVTSPPEA